MTTPFPGMDPHLEHPSLWPGVHNWLITALASQLQPRLAPRYIASIEERVYLEQPQRQRNPDVAIHKVRDSGAVAVAEADAPVILELIELEIHENFIEILDRYNAMKLVALIEVVSPSNKEGGAGRESYLAKQRATLARECHLVDIDLLRRGRPVVAAPASLLATLGTHDYLACVSRWPQRKRFELYPTRLRERLPRVKLPLLEPDADVPIDIQAALAHVYWEGRYMLRLRYDEPCEPALEPDDQQWATERWLAYQAANAELFPRAGR